MTSCTVQLNYCPLFGNWLGLSVRFFESAAVLRVTASLTCLTCIRLVPRACVYARADKFNIPTSVHLIWNYASQ